MRTATAHTPGPWIARQEFANRWRIESHAAGPDFVPVSVGVACTTILEVGCNNKDTAVNARLIAAAPDMLQALIQARGALRLDAMVDKSGQPFGTTAVAMDAIDAAISKATGEQP